MSVRSNADSVGTATNHDDGEHDDGRAGVEPSGGVGDHGMSDDTQDPRTQPGEQDVAPPLFVSRSYVDLHEPLTLPGHCLVGDGHSCVSTTPPNYDSRQLADDIDKIVLRLRDDPKYVRTVKMLLNLDGLDRREMGS
jgi:hypothetical protein